MKVIAAAAIGFAYLFALEVSEQFAPRWVWVWYVALATHFLLVVVLAFVSLFHTATRRIKAGAPGTRPGTRTNAPAKTKED